MIIGHSSTQLQLLEEQITITQQIEVMKGVITGVTMGVIEVNQDNETVSVRMVPKSLVLCCLLQVRRSKKVVELV